MAKYLKKYKADFSLILLLSSLLLSPFIWLPGAEANKGAQESAKQLYEKARQEYYQLTKSKIKRADRGEWLYCIDQFDKVIDKFPQSHEGYKATFTIARLYHGLNKELGVARDLDNALRYYWSLLSEYTVNHLSDDALIHLGETYIEKKNYISARQAFRNVLLNFPDGDQIALAKKYIREVEPRAEKQLSANNATKIKSPTLLDKLDYSVSPDAVRITVHTSNPVSFIQNRLADPERIYFNFKNTRLAENLTRNIKLKSGLLSQVRLSQFNSETSRMVLDVISKRQTMVTTRQEGSTLIIEVLTASAHAASQKTQPLRQVSAVKSMRATAERQTIKRPPIAVKPAPKQKSSKNPTPLIVVDAGHGGKDYGAKGQNGLLEKDVNLSISLMLKTILEKRYKYRVALTRKDDTFIPLKGRGEIANQKDADLFVSVHANAAKRKSAKGIETYYLGSASSERALATATRENGEIVHSVPDDQVQKILASLITTTKLNDSARVAGTVQKRLHKTMSMKYSGVNNLGVKEGPFFVLHDTNMPSILVEVGFVSNKLEESRLKNKEYLRSLAGAIAQGIHEHIKSRAPTI